MWDRAGHGSCVSTTPRSHAEIDGLDGPLGAEMAKVCDRCRGHVRALGRRLIVTLLYPAIPRPTETAGMWHNVRLVEQPGEAFSLHALGYVSAGRVTHEVKTLLDRSVVR
jgi:hypothetical protein